MSTLTDVIAHPATAAQELDRLREELRDATRQSIRVEGWAQVFDAEVERQEQRVKRLEWTLKAIDNRLHNAAAHTVTFDPAGPQQVMALSCEDFAQICRVIVAATGRQP